MNQIRQIIRESLERLYLEVVVRPHFKERVYDRLESDSTTFKDEKLVVKDIVFNNIKFLEEVNIDTLDNIAFLLIKGPNKYVYHREIPGKATEHSEGPYVWAITRGNFLETVVFGDAGYVPKNTQIQLTVDRLRNFIYDENNGKMTLTKHDIEKLTTPSHKKTQSSEPKKQEIVINILGTKWVLDPKNETMFKKNKPSDSVSVWDLLDDKIENLTIDQDTKDEIMSHLM